MPTASPPPSAPQRRAAARQCSRPSTPAPAQAGTPACASRTLHTAAAAAASHTPRPATPRKPAPPDADSVAAAPAAAACVGGRAAQRTPPTVPPHAPARRARCAARIGRTAAAAAARASALALPAPRPTSPCQHSLVRVRAPWPCGSRRCMLPKRPAPWLPCDSVPAAQTCRTAGCAAA